MNLTVEQKLALDQYADQHGAEWRDNLRADWMTGRDIGHLLRQVRNQGGPTWLETYRPEAIAMHINAGDFGVIASAIDWAYRNGYTGGDRAGQVWARLTGTTLEKEDLGTYGDTMKWTPKREDDNAKT